MRYNEIINPLDEVFNISAKIKDDAVDIPATTKYLLSNYVELHQVTEDIILCKTVKSI